MQLVKRSQPWWKRSLPKVWILNFSCAMLQLSNDSLLKQWLTDHTDGKRFGCRSTHGEHACFNHATHKCEVHADVPCSSVPVDPWQGKSRTELWRTVVKLMPDDLVLQTYRDILKKDIQGTLKPGIGKGDTKAIREQLMKQTV